MNRQIDRQTNRHITKLIKVNNHSHNCPLITRPQKITLLLVGVAPCTNQRDPGESVYSGNTGVLLRQVEVDHAHMLVYTSASLSLSQPLLQLELFFSHGFFTQGARISASTTQTYELQIPTNRLNPVTVRNLS